MLHGNVLDIASPQERTIVCKTLHDLKQSQLLPFKWPAKDEPVSKALYQSIVILLEVLRGTWNPGIKVPMWRPETMREFRDMVTMAARAYRSRMEAQADKPRDLHAWLFNDHPDQECLASGLMSEVQRIKKAQEAPEGVDARTMLKEALTPAEIRRLDARISQCPDAKAPHPAGYWKTLAGWQNFMQERERDIRFHGSLNRGWFRVPTRRANAAEMLNLFDSFKIGTGQQITSWLPRIGSEEWSQLVYWLREQEGTEQFVDLEYRSPLSLQEQEEHLVRADIEQITKQVQADESLAHSLSVIIGHVDAYDQGLKEISTPLHIWADMMLRLSRVARGPQGGHDTFKAARALVSLATTLPPDLWPNEEVLAAEFAQAQAIRLRNFWFEEEPNRYKRGMDVGLFQGLPEVVVAE